MQRRIISLRAFFDLQFRNTQTTSIWSIAVQPSEAPKGWGYLVGNARYLSEHVEACNQAGYSVHVALPTFVTPEQYSGSKVSRAELTVRQIRTLLIDIDCKDNLDENGAWIPRAKLLRGVGMLKVKPSGVVRSANGLHIYYNFKQDITPYMKSLHETICEQLKDYKVNVDPMAGSMSKGTIRCPGSLGKDGKVMKGKYTDRRYGLKEFTRLIGLSMEEVKRREYLRIDSEPAVIKCFGKRSWGVHLPEESLRSSCPAFDKFVSDAYENNFHGGRFGNFKDIRTFASLNRYVFDPDVPETRDPDYRNHATRQTIAQWPDADSSFTEPHVAYGENDTYFPPKCTDSWGEYSSFCENCDHRTANLSAIQCAHGDSLRSGASITPPALAFSSPRHTATVNQRAALASPSAPATVAMAVPQFKDVEHGNAMPPGYQRGITINPIEGIKVARMVKGVEVFDDVVTPALVPRMVMQDADDLHRWVLDGGTVRDNVVTPVTLTLDRSDISNNARFTERLHDKGYILGRDGVEGLRLFFKKFVYNNPITSSVGGPMGWSEDFLEFNTPVGKMCSDGRFHIRPEQFLEESLGRCDFQPSPMPWVDNVLTPMIHDERMYPHLLLVLSAMVSPMFKLSSVGSGPIVSLVGTTGQAKTLALGICATVWGGKGMSHLSTQDTGPGKDNTLGLFNNLPVLFDEATDMDHEKLSEFALFLTRGSAKAAANGTTGYNRDAARWCNIVLASTNEPLQGKLIGEGDAYEAMLSRVIDIKLPAKVEDAALASRFELIRKNAEYYASAMAPLLAKYYQDNRDSILHRMHFEPNGEHVVMGSTSRFSDHLERFIKILLSDLASANYITQQLCDNFCLYMHREFTGVKQDNVVRVREEHVTVRKIMEAISHNIVPFEPKEFETWARSVGAGYRHMDPDEYLYEDSKYYYITQNKFNSILTNRFGVNPKNVQGVRRSLESTGDLIPAQTGSGRGQYRRRLPIVGAGSSGSNITYVTKTSQTRVLLLRK